MHKQPTPWGSQSQITTGGQWRPCVTHHSQRALPRWQQQQRLSRVKTVNSQRYIVGRGEARTVKIPPHGEGRYPSHHTTATPAYHHGFRQVQVISQRINMCNTPQRPYHHTRKGVPRSPPTPLHRTTNGGRAPQGLAIPRAPLAPQRGHAAAMSSRRPTVRATPPPARPTRPYAPDPAHQ